MFTQVKHRCKGSLKRSSDIDNGLGCWGLTDMLKVSVGGR